MTDKKQLEKELLEVFEQEMEVVVPSVETDLMETGYLDSLMFVQLLAVLEEKYGIQVEIEDLEYEYFRSIEKIAAFVEKRAVTEPKS